MSRVQELRAEEVLTVIRESDTNTELSTARIAESDFRIQDTWGRQIYNDICFNFLFIVYFYISLSIFHIFVSPQWKNTTKGRTVPQLHLNACLPACLLACLLVCLPACLPYQSACLLAGRLRSLPVCLPAWRLACLSALNAFLPASLPAGMPACLPISMPICLPACLFTWMPPECCLLSIRMPACQFICVFALMFIRYKYMEPAGIHIEITNLSIHSARRRYCVYENVRICTDFLYIVHMTVLQQYQHYY